MARAAGPLGNSPRDTQDDFVGEEAEDVKAGQPPKKARNPTKVKKPPEFHAKVSGGSSAKRADRASYYRRGGFVSARKDGGQVAKRAFGGDFPTLGDYDKNPNDFVRVPPPIIPPRTPSPGRLSDNSPADDSITINKNVPDPVPPKAEPPRASAPPPMPKPRPRPVVKASAPVSRSEPPPKLNTIPGGPGSANYGSGGYKGGGPVKK